MQVGNRGTERTVCQAEVADVGQAARAQSAQAAKEERECCLQDGGGQRQEGQSVTEIGQESSQGENSLALTKVKLTAPEFRVTTPASHFIDKSSKLAASNDIINITFMNLRGQTGLSLSKQLQIQQFIIDKKIDICHLQESNIEDDTFTSCNLISSRFEILETIVLVNMVQPVW